MPRPLKPTRAELQLKQENNRLTTALALLRGELENKIKYVGRLEFLLSLRMERISDLNGTVAKLRDQNKRLDAEAERLAEIVRLPPEARY